MSLRIFFLRHGNTFEDGQPSRQVGAKTDMLLTGKGRAQAATAAAWLRGRGFMPSMVYSGRLKRQTETAEIVAAALHTECATTDDLVEIEYGAWEGLTIEELKNAFPVSYEAWSKTGEWSEEFGGSFEDARRRLSLFLDQIRSTHGDDATLLAVTSQGVMKLLTSVIDPSRWADLQARRAMDELKVKTGALCEIVLENGSWKTVAWNVVPDERG